MSAKPKAPPRGGARRPLFVECNECGHSWVAAFLPLAVADLGRVLTGARCAHCGGKSISVLPTEKENGQ